MVAEASPLNHTRLLRAGHRTGVPRRAVAARTLKQAPPVTYAPAPWIDATDPNDLKGLKAVVPTMGGTTKVQLINASIVNVPLTPEEAALPAVLTLVDVVNLGRELPLNFIGL